MQLGNVGDHPRVPWTQTEHVFSRQAEHQNQRSNHLNTLAAPQMAGGSKHHLLMQPKAPPTDCSGLGW